MRGSTCIIIITRAMLKHSKASERMQLAKENVY